MPDKFELQKFAVPAVVTLIIFLAYASQLLFLSLEPGRLSRAEQWKFNILVACIWLTYFRTVTVDPGHVPKDWTHPDVAEDGSHVRKRYCRRCEAAKPPRSHHCKVCQRCIPKMDHHCPWTGNCVSHFTLPHFMRFLFYAVASMTQLEFFLWARVMLIWDDRNLPSYLGPSANQLALLFILVLATTLTLFAVSIMFLRSLYDLCCNTTTIENWEIERHAQLLRRARTLGGYLDGPDGIRIKIVHQEFPYDIGIWANVCQGMGTKNVLAWFWPFAETPRTSGLTFSTNGFEDPGASWPPPDPDRIPRLQRDLRHAEAFTYGRKDLAAGEEIAQFKQRQQSDIRRKLDGDHVIKRKPFHERFDAATFEPLPDTDVVSDEESGEEGWQNNDGSRLKDYGLDEEAEFYDEDNIPLAELIRQRRAMQAT